MTVCTHVRYAAEARRICTHSKEGDDMSPLWFDGTMSTGQAVLLAVGVIIAVVSLISLKIQSDKDNKSK